MQGQDINIEDIIEALNQSTADNEHMSLRFSEDYQLNYNRYTKEDEFQEISFDLSNEDQSLEMSSSLQNDVQVHENNTFQQLSNLIQAINQESVPSQNIEKPTKASKIISLNRKTSLKTSSKLKKKMSLRKQADQFTKKYDDLFDQIFMRKGQKNEKELMDIKQSEYKKQESLISTNHQILTGSNVSEPNLQSIQAVSQAQNLSLQPVLAQKPKITINYHPKLTTSQKVIELQNNRSPRIKFSYGQQTRPSKRQSVNPFIISNCTGEELRLPSFLVYFRSMTNNYPNFYSKRVLQEQNCKKINKQFKQMLRQCKQSINSLKQAHLKLHQLFKCVRELYRRMNCNLINNSPPDQQMLTFFLTIEWCNLTKTKELETIKPKDVFLNRVFNELQFITLVNNFQEILSKVEQQTLVDAQNPESIKKYMESRDKLWGIEKNLRLMSEDLYLHSLSHFNLPSHIIQSYTFLKQVASKQVAFGQQQQTLLSRLLFLQQKKDIFSQSWLGVHTIKTLCNLSK